MKTMWIGGICGVLGSGRTFETKAAAYKFFNEDPSGRWVDKIQYERVPLEDRST